MDRWLTEAIYKIEADFTRSADTHLLKVDLPAIRHVSLYLKDESTHPTGSLKHRLARSLFLYGLCNGFIKEGTPIIESSSGNTAVSEAYFARLLGLPFIAVVPEGTSKTKIESIEFYGGRCQFAPATGLDEAARELADSLGGHYMDQFTYAERATDWRGNNNIAESIFSQMAHEKHPVPAWIVTSAGTGGTSATLGRFIRYRGHATQLCVADPSNSAFFDYFHSGDRATTAPCSHIEGIGRPRVEPSFVRSVIDRMIKVPDEAAFATMRHLERLLNRRCGGSTGTNLYATFQIIAELEAEGTPSSVVSLICDGGERYVDTYYQDAWLRDHGFDVSRYVNQLNEFVDRGVWQETEETS